MARYAETTKVPVEKTIAEAKTELKRIGAQRMMVMEDGAVAQVYFEFFDGDAKRVFMIETPPVDEKAKDVEQETRRAWRALLLLVKAKRVAIQDGITTIEREFLADAVMPDGSRLADHAPKMIEDAYREGGPPRLQLGYSA